MEDRYREEIRCQTGQARDGLPVHALWQAEECCYLSLSLSSFLPLLFIHLLELCSFDLLIDEADQAAYTVVS